MGCERTYLFPHSVSTEISNPQSTQVRPQLTRESVPPTTDSLEFSELAFDASLENVITDSFRELFILEILEIAGGHFRGILRGDENTPWLVLFDGVEYSTLAVKLDDLSVETVREKLAANAALFAEARAKAAVL